MGWDMSITRGRVLLVVSVIVSVATLIYVFRGHIPVTIELVKDILTIGFFNACVFSYKIYQELQKTNKELENERILNEARDLIDRLDDTLTDFEDTVNRLSSEQRDKLIEAAKQKNAEDLKLLMEETKTPKCKKEEANEMVKVEKKLDKEVVLGFLKRRKVAIAIAGVLLYLLAQLPFVSEHYLITVEYCDDVKEVATCEVVSENLFDAVQGIVGEIFAE